jgi:hypothetical protein
MKNIYSRRLDIVSYGDIRWVGLDHRDQLGKSLVYFDVDEKIDRSDNVKSGLYEFDVGCTRRIYTDEKEFDTFKTILSKICLLCTLNYIDSNPSVYKGLYFYELIHFNNYGVIGPKTSFKLYKDFIENYVIIKDLMENYVIIKDLMSKLKYIDWLEMFKDLLKLFDLASNKGYVQFR